MDHPDDDLPLDLPGLPPRRGKPRALPPLPPLPFAPLPTFDEATKRRLKAAALRANERYLTTFLEEHSICPFARGGRAQEQTTRFVHFVDSDDPTPFVDLLVQAASNPSWGVVQVILPLVEIGPEAWTAFCHAITAAGNARVGRRETFAVAPLHPELSYSQLNPFTLIPLFRRAPDPTIQWVRLDALKQIYAGRSAVDIYVSPEDLPAFLKTPRRKPLFDRIAETNLKMALRLGIDNIERTLHDLRRHVQAAYRDVLLSEHPATDDDSPDELSAPVPASSIAAVSSPAAEPLRAEGDRWALVATRDLPLHTPRRFVVEGVELVAVRTKETVHVLFGRCPHRMAPLDQAIVEQEHLVCAFHGWDFRLDSGKSDGVPGESIHRFEAVVEEGLVWVEAAEVRRIGAAPTEAFAMEDVVL